jgi:hypothetical protein
MFITHLCLSHTYHYHALIHTLLHALLRTYHALVTLVMHWQFDEWWGASQARAVEHSVR